jgi:hypothetical protein
MSKLLQCCYRLFECDEPAAAAAARDEAHDFGGELVLTFADGRELYVSWVAEPVQYAIGIKNSSHFLPDTQLGNFDVTGSAMWSDLIGQDVSLHFVAPDNQVLKASSATGHLLICSFERGGWWADEVTVCKQIPTPHYDDASDL